MAKDKQISDQPKRSDPPAKGPPAGPHGKPALIDPIKTPGSGALPDPDDRDTDASTG